MDRALGAYCHSKLFIDACLSGARRDKAQAQAGVVNNLPAERTFSLRDDVPPSGRDGRAFHEPSWPCLRGIAQELREGAVTGPADESSR
jgi:hypothetical protein